VSNAFRTYKVMEGLVVKAFTISSSVIDANESKTDALVRAAHAFGDYRGEYGNLSAVRRELKKHISEEMLNYLLTANDSKTIQEMVATRPVALAPKDLKGWNGKVQIANEGRVGLPALSVARQLPNPKKQPRLDERVEPDSH